MLFTRLSIILVTYTAATEKLLPQRLMDTRLVEIGHLFDLPLAVVCIADNLLRN